MVFDENRHKPQKGPGCHGFWLAIPCCHFFPLLDIILIYVVSAPDEATIWLAIFAWCLCEMTTL